ncbi:MAG: S9 family peptidase [Acidimicrobiia bacterium]|nr:S9 family peptidase [Acidimicrobiia bacterium]
MNTTPFGSWPSAITAAKVVEGVTAIGEIRLGGDDVWWSETRPEENGRNQLVRRSGDGTLTDLFADPMTDPGVWNARTQVHEYGGGAWAVRDGVVVFANWADQRLYRVDPGGDPLPLTPQPAVVRGLRFAEPSWLDDRWLVAICEDHLPETVADHGEAVNRIVAIPLDGSAVDDPGRVVTLVTGPDFVAFPVTAGDRLAWMQWDHPNMPWDSTSIWMGSIERDHDGAPRGVAEATRVAGGDDTSVVQPAFTGAGDLIFCADASGWWNPQRVTGSGSEPVLATPVEAEIGGPAWIHGLRWMAPLRDGRIACSVTRGGFDGLGVIDADGELIHLDTPFVDVRQVVPGGVDDEVLLVAGTALAAPAPYRFRLDAGSWERLTPVDDHGVAEAAVSVAEAIDFPSTDGRTAHALFYPPVNPDVTAPDDELPPLLVFIHGGPTSAASPAFSLGRQFWTSRGFAVVDVNYGGSTGFGTAYRGLLDEAWGVVDVEDCLAAARYLVGQGQVDPDRLAIRGGSAGGFTTLAALAFHDLFNAGASHFGVADLEALAVETHKFESRYLDSLVGPYPEAADIYRDRSPIHHVDGFDTPLIVFQGLEDEVVPPNQAEMMIEALAAKGVPHAYVPFEGEQHGFRIAANIARALEAELWFYGRVFGFTPADPIEPVPGAVGL